MSTPLSWVQKNYHCYKNFERRKQWELFLNIVFFLVPLLMVQNTKVARNDFVLKICPGWDINTIAVVSNDDDSALESDITTKSYISRDGQVIKFQNVGDGLETLQEIFDLEYV